MKHTQKHIDDLFKEKLGGYSEVPPADAWDDLDKKLDTLVPHVPVSPYRWIGHAAMVSVIAVLSVSLIQKFVGKTDGNNEIVKEQTINKLDAANATLETNNTTTSISGTNVPSIEAAGEDNNGNNQDANGNAPALAAAESEEQATGNKGASNTNNSKSKSNNNGGKQPNYAPYNNGLANTGGKVSNPAQLNSYNGSVNENKIEPKGENKNRNAIENQFGAQNAETELLATKPWPSAAKTEPTKQPIAIKTPEVKKAEAKKPHQKPDFARWEAGVKGGYERGFNNIAATKYVIAPYLQYNISKKAAIVIQPAVKYATSATRTIGTPQSYYTINNDGKVVDNGSYKQPVLEGTTVDTIYHAKYRYTQTHDSTVKTNKVGGTYMEYELPVLFKYSVSKKVAVYGGTNIVFSQMKGVTEHTYTKAGISRTVDTMMSGDAMAPAPNISDVIKYDGSPFSSYNGPLYPAPQDSRIRFGAMLGFSYEYSDRWLLDALIQQNPAPKDIRGGLNINAPLSATYFRLSVGYKLTK